MEEINRKSQMSKIITIFTPAYNREKLLSRLYLSLCNQTCDDFMWLIVDDGSVDDTESLVRGWTLDGRVDIQYIKQSNGGKHRAHNRGVRECETELFMCVDSDDWLVENAVANILKGWNMCDKQSISGVLTQKEIVGKKCDATIINNEKVMTRTPLTTLWNLYRSGFVGETSIAFRSDLLKKHLYPEYDGEKFVTEAVVYEEVDREFPLLILPLVTTICEYQEAGYTANEKNLYKNNPRGWALRFNQRAKNPQSIKERVVCCAKYVCFSNMANQNWLKEANYKLLSVLSYPLAKLYQYKKYN